MNHLLFLSFLALLATLAAYLDEKWFRTLTVMALFTIAINVSLMAWRQK